MRGKIQAAHNLADKIRLALAGVSSGLYFAFVDHSDAQGYPRGSRADWPIDVLRKAYRELDDARQKEIERLIR